MPSFNNGNMYASEHFRHAHRRPRGGDTGDDRIEIRKALSVYQFEFVGLRHVPRSNTKTRLSTRQKVGCVNGCR